MTAIGDDPAAGASAAPRPAQRVGDAERDAAVQRLQAHHAEGRLGVDEFDERMTAALQAKTQADLDPLFLDLPEQVPPTAELAPLDPDEDAAERERRRDEGELDLPADDPPWANALRVLSWAAFPIAIVCLIAFGEFWPMLVAIFIAPSGHALADSARKNRLEAARRKQLP